MNKKKKEKDAGIAVKEVGVKSLHMLFSYFDDLSG